MKTHPLHEEALKLALNFQQLEADLIDILEKIDREKIFLALGFSSLFTYAVGALKLSEANAYQFIQVARKTREVPELQVEIKSGAISVSKAKRIVPVLTAENQNEWLEKARVLPKAALEKEVVRVAPEEGRRESLRQISAERVLLHLSLSDALAKKLRRTQSLLVSKNRKSVNLEETLEAALDLFLQLKDPVEKAERMQKKKQVGPGPVEKKNSGGNVYFSIGRRAIPAALKSQVFLRDRGRCSFRSSDGRICGSPSFIQLHHRHSIAHGGRHTLENLQTLCQAHHAFHHRNLQCEV